MSTAVTNPDVLDVLVVINGGPGSGHHGHKGIPGQRGGSLPADGSTPKTSGGSPSRAALVRAIAGAPPSTPGNSRRSAKNAYTKTAKMADLWGARAKELEKKKKRFRGKKRNKELAEAHLKASEFYKAAANQATMVRGTGLQQQLDRLRQAAEHEALGRMYAGKLQPGKLSKVGGAVGRVAAKAGGALATGVGEAIFDDWMKQKGFELGAAGTQAVEAAIHGGVKRALEGRKMVQDTGPVEKGSKEEYDDPWGEKKTYRTKDKKVDTSGLRTKKPKTTATFKKDMPLSELGAAESLIRSRGATESDINEIRDEVESTPSTSRTPRNVRETVDQLYDRPDISKGAMREPKTAPMTPAQREEIRGGQPESSAVRGQTRRESLMDALRSSVRAGKEDIRGQFKRALEKKPLMDEIRAAKRMTDRSRAMTRDANKFAKLIGRIKGNVTPEERARTMLAGAGYDPDEVPELMAMAEEDPEAMRIALQRRVDQVQQQHDATAGDLEDRGVNPTEAGHFARQDARHNNPAEVYDAWEQRSQLPETQPEIQRYETTEQDLRQAVDQGTIDHPRAEEIKDVVNAGILTMEEAMEMPEAELEEMLDERVPFNQRFDEVTALASKSDYTTAELGAMEDADLTKLLDQQARSDVQEVREAGSAARDRQKAVEVRTAGSPLSKDKPNIDEEGKAHINWDRDMANPEDRRALSFELGVAQGLFDFSDALRIPAAELDPILDEIAEIQSRSPTGGAYLPADDEERLEGKIDILVKRYGVDEMTDNFTRLVANLSGTLERRTLHGREHIVAPLTMIVPGVLPGSKGPLFYPEVEVAKNPGNWNGIPIVLNHPMENGRPVEARNPNVLNKYQLGFVFNARYEGGKLVAEGWFDIERTRAVNTSIYDSLLHQKPIELSTGLYTENQPFNGTWNDRPYTHVARNYRPDHLAILLGSKGACSIKDGCGVLVNKSELQNNRIIGAIKKLAKAGVKKTPGTGVDLAKDFGVDKAKGAVGLDEFNERTSRNTITQKVDNAIDRTKLRKQAVGAGLGAGGAAAGGLGGAKVGAGIGAALAPVTGGLSIPIGGLLGAGAGAALGTAAGRGAAREVAGKTGAKAAGIGGIAGGLVGGGGVTRGAAKGATAAGRTVSRMFGRSAGKKAVSAAAKKRFAKMTGKKVAKGIGKAATEEAGYIGGEALERRSRQRGLPVKNEWTEEARRKSLETRRRRAQAKSKRSKMHPKIAESAGMPEESTQFSDLVGRGAGFAAGGALIIEGRSGTKALLQKLQKGGAGKKAADKLESVDLPVGDPSKIRSGPEQFKKTVRSAGSKRSGKAAAKRMLKPGKKAAKKIGLETVEKAGKSGSLRRGVAKVLRVLA